MESIRLIVADGDSRNLNGMVASLKKRRDIEVIASTTDGAELIHQTRTLKPDVLVTALMLKNVDGLGVLEALTQLNMPLPRTLIVTSIRDDRFVASALKLGAMYCLFKPVELEIVYRRVTQLARDPENEYSVKRDTAILPGLLAEMGLLTDHKGTDYLSAASDMCFKDRDCIDVLTKRLYPAIARQYGTSAYCVERAIRHAISSAWLSGRLDRFAAIHDMPDLIRRRPTNREMIARIVSIMDSRAERE